MKKRKQNPGSDISISSFMKYLPSFVVHGTHLLNETRINDYAQQYYALLKALSDGHEFADVASDETVFLNDINLK